jgi:hypothetical protein
MIQTGKKKQEISNQDYHNDHPDFEKHDLQNYRILHPQLCCHLFRDETFNLNLQA